jgi:hypothetical protein
VDAVTGIALGEFAATAGPPCEVAVAALDAMPGPAFDVQRGGPVARIAKRIANLVLRPFGRPQRWMNEASAKRCGPRSPRCRRSSATSRDGRGARAASDGFAALEERAGVALDERAVVDRRT